MPPASQKFCFATLVPSKYDISSPSICLIQSRHPTKFGWTHQVTKRYVKALACSCNLGILMVCSQFVDLCSQLKQRQTAHIKSKFEYSISKILQAYTSGLEYPWCKVGLAIRVPRTCNCVLTVPLAVRKTLRTVLDACLQLPENPDLPRWFQAKMTFRVNLSDTKRAHRQDVCRITFRNHLQLR